MGRGVSFDHAVNVSAVARPRRHAGERGLLRPPAPNAFYSSANPQNSVLVAGHGVTATVTGQSGNILTGNVVNPAG